MDPDWKLQNAASDLDSVLFAQDSLSHRSNYDIDRKGLF